MLRRNKSGATIAIAQFDNANHAGDVAVLLQCSVRSSVSECLGVRQVVAGVGIIARF